MSEERKAMTMKIKIQPTRWVLTNDSFFILYKHFPNWNWFKFNYMTNTKLYDKI